MNAIDNARVAEERELLADVLYVFFVRGDGLHDVVAAEQAIDDIIATGFRLQGPVTDTEVETAANVHIGTPGTIDEKMRAALEAARAV